LENNPPKLQIKSEYVSQLNEFPFISIWERFNSL